jgi:hypothetical protein
LDARWSEQEDAERYHVRLDAGTIRLASKGKATENRLVVDVPDGYIQDRGTRFTVTVEFQKTQRIAVEQGAIVFSRSDGSLVFMSEGQTWQREGKGQTAESPFAQQEQKTAAPRVVNAPIQPLAIQIPRENRRAPSERVHLTQNHQGEIAPAPSTTLARQTGSEEDIAYLKILKLLSESRREEARIAAQEYLQHFPTGFRKLEVERIAQ